MFCLWCFIGKKSCFAVLVMFLMKILKERKLKVLKNTADSNIHCTLVNIRQVSFLFYLIVITTQLLAL